MNTVSDLTIGESAVGSLTVQDGGFVLHKCNTRRGWSPGLAVVTGVNQDPSELAVSSQLTVGKSDLGNLIVNDGGQVSAHDLTAGSAGWWAWNRGGARQVRCHSPSVLAATENVILGLEGRGVLIIEEEGAVTCSGAALGVFAGSEGAAFLGVDNAPPGAPAQWLVHGDMMIGGLAPGSIALHNGAAVTVDNNPFHPGQRINRRQWHLYGADGRQ